MLTHHILAAKSLEHFQPTTTVSTVSPDHECFNMFRSATDHLLFKTMESKISTYITYIHIARTCTEMWIKRINTFCTLHELISLLISALSSSLNSGTQCESWAKFYNLKPAVLHVDSIYHRFILWHWPSYLPPITTTDVKSELEVDKINT